MELRGVLLPRHGFMELRSGFIEIMLRCGCSSVGLLRIFRAPFPESTSGKLLLSLSFLSKNLHNSFQVFIILFKSREITYIPSITSDQLHAFLISKVPWIMYFPLSRSIVYITPFVSYPLNRQMPKCKASSNQRLKWRFSFYMDPSGMAMKLFSVFFLLI